MSPVSRRILLASLPFARLRAAQKGQVFTAEGVRYADPATEFLVERFTDPQFPSYWPLPYARSIARRGAFFLFASDRGDGLQAFRYELKSGEAKQLTAATRLHSGSLNLLPDERTFVYADGQSVYLAPLSTLKERQVYRVPEGWELGDGFSISGDGVNIALIEKQGTKSRLRLVGVAGGAATTLIEHEGELRHPQTRPRRASVLYQKDTTLCLVHYDGKNDLQLGTMVPSPGAALWSVDGRTVSYLAPKGNSVYLREVVPDTRQDKEVTLTSQFHNFQRNVDGSVLVAASRSVAQPYILIMLRQTRRELTVCEHKASDPKSVHPVFSPTSQRIYFQSDRHGKPAIYSIVVDKFIEKTES
ncbi:MAG: PD40 domain-containing protein [Acidobacteria bacterium]|nr:PD40 domain-containing protein [Acidobacteriota bacterium]